MPEHSEFEPPMANGRPRAMVLLLLGLTQIIGFGTLYYSIAIVAGMMAKDLGVGTPLVFGAFTAGSLVYALATPFSGRMVDRLGGRVVLSGGSLCAALAFVMLASATNPVLLFAGWVVAGIAMSACLYRTLFATLHQMLPAESYRNSVTVVTLLGGFASTIFWPLSNALSQALGWRVCFFIFAAFHLVICTTIHAALLPKGPPTSSEHETERSDSPPEGTVPWRDPRLMALTMGIAAVSFVFAVISAFLITILRSKGLPEGTAIAIAALIGPLQVAGRLVEWLFGKRASLRAVGLATHAVFLVALVLLFLAGGVVESLAFVLLYGFAAGVMTIIQNTVPLVIFPHAKPGYLLAQTAFPGFLASAVAPSLFAVVAQTPGGLQIGLAGIAGLSGVAGFCFWRALRR